MTELSSAATAALIQKRRMALNASLQADHVHAWAVHCALVSALRLEGIDNAIAHRATAHAMIMLHGVDTEENPQFNPEYRRVYQFEPSAQAPRAPDVAPARHAVANLRAYSEQPGRSEWPGGALWVLDQFIDEVERAAALAKPDASATST